MPRSRLCYACRQPRHIASFCPSEQLPKNSRGAVVPTTASHLYVNPLSERRYHVVIAELAAVEAQRMQTRLSRREEERLSKTAVLRDSLEYVAQNGFEQGYEYYCRRMAKQHAKASA